MRGSDVYNLDLNGFHDLEFEFLNEFKNETQTITIKNLMLTREPQCLIAGANASDENAVFLLEIADKRWALGNHLYSHTINAAYGVRNMATNSPMSSYSWSDMVQELWLSMPLLGSWPGLPYIPSGTPTNWQFRGIPAIDALCSVLSHLSLSIRYRLDGSYDIVEYSGSDANQEDLENKNIKRKIYDARFLEITKPRVPQTIRVMFHRWYSHGGSENTISMSGHWQMHSTYSVDVASGESSNNIVHAIWSDQLAYTLPDGSLDTGVSTTLNAVANELANSYIENCLQPRLGRRYSGLIPFETGKNCKAVTWKCGAIRSLDEGIWTEIVWHPFSDFSPSEGRFLSSQNQTPDFSPTFPISSALPNFVESAGEIPLGEMVSATHRIWDQNTETWVNKSAAKFLAIPDETYLGRLVGNVGNVPIFAGQGNSWGDVYIDNIYNVSSIEVTAINVSNLTVNNLEIKNCTDQGVIKTIKTYKPTCVAGVARVYVTSYVFKHSPNGCMIIEELDLGYYENGCCDCTDVGGGGDDHIDDHCCLSTYLVDEACLIFQKKTEPVAGTCSLCPRLPEKWLVRLDGQHISGEFELEYYALGSDSTRCSWRYYDVTYTTGNWDYLEIEVDYHEPSNSIGVKVSGYESTGNVSATIYYDLSVTDCEGLPELNFSKTTDFNDLGVFDPGSGTWGPSTYTPIDIQVKALGAGANGNVSDVVNVCVTLVSGEYTGTIEIDSVEYSVGIACVDKNWIITLDDGADTYQIVANYYACDEFKMFFEGVINGERFIISLIENACCEDQNNSSSGGGGGGGNTEYGMCPDTDTGFGGTDWVWNESSGIWEISALATQACTGDSSPNYPPRDGIYDGENYSTWCCPYAANTCATSYNYGTGLVYEVPFGPNSNFWIEVDPGTVSQVTIQKIGGTCNEPFSGGCTTWSCTGLSGGCSGTGIFSHLDLNTDDHIFPTGPETGPFKINIYSDADVSGICRLVFS